MGVQSRVDNSNIAFVLAGLSLVVADAVIAQDGGRSDPLLFGTVMSKVAATKKWVPFINETAVDGAALPQGVYMGPDIAPADIVAGDVVDLPILVGDALVDVNQIVIENAKTLGTVIDAGSVNARTVKDQLAYRSIFMEDTVNISDFEN